MNSVNGVIVDEGVDGRKDALGVGLVVGGRGRGAGGSAGLVGEAGDGSVEGFGDEAVEHAG